MNKPVEEALIKERKLALIKEIEEKLKSYEIKKENYEIFEKSL